MATAEQPPAAAPALSKPKSKLPVLIVLGLMAVEGVAIFAVTKFLLAPAPAGAHGATAEEHGLEADSHGPPAADAQLTAELDLAECRPSNTQTGKLIIFKIRVSALVMRSQLEDATALIEANKARITDRINYVFRSAEPEHVKEPGLDTIKRRLKQELDYVLGDEHLIREILIPEMLQSSFGL